MGWFHHPIFVLTHYHAAYFAHELRKRCAADDPDKLAEALLDAKVELNPHQVEAALFAFQSPLSKGAILADEVGLGKTIEAGLLLAQKWAEKRRNSHLLVIAPANLRKQWQQELSDKFFLPCEILEAKSYRKLKSEGYPHPFNLPKIVICSYHFARTKADDIKALKWDLVVIDEAHRLRNVYKPSAVIARALKDALGDSHKVLLTATPLQNSLLELFGLVSVIDEHTFGDLRSFREQFSNLNDQSTFDLLKARIQPLVQRTLRRDVKNINFTKRIAIVQRFIPAEDEHRLYNLVSEYLQRDNLVALPPSQRKLMTLVLRKLLASSSFAIAGALDTLANRLREKITTAAPSKPLAEKLDEDFEALDEMTDEWDAEDDVAEAPLSTEEQASIQREIADLEQFRQLAVSIEENSKGQALLTALQEAFSRAPALHALPKALVFTESRKTQDYLVRLLEKSPWKDGLVLFNGSNNDPSSRRIYKEWCVRYKDTDRITGSPSADMRSALVDYFREKGSVMIATEAGAEGINLQFCSLIVNYDLPWNPQRVEQRIGRCHRYGQKCDVVVVNFLNEKNEADQRVYDLLAQKFQLFEGVFGASDEVLGAIESGVDFEKRIAAIYQRCRTPIDIKQSFEQLQLELGAELADSLSQTRKALIENFDDEVREKVRVHAKDSLSYRNRYEELLMKLTRHELADCAVFCGADGAFDLVRTPDGANPDALIPLGRYELPRRSDNAHFYRLGHALADEVIRLAKERSLPPCEVLFDYQAYEGQNSQLELFVGHHGWLAFSIFTLEALDQTEDYLLFAAFADDGRELDPDDAKRLLAYVPGRLGAALPPAQIPARLERLTQSLQDTRRRDISQRNAALFEKEAAKLDAWADDRKLALERDIKELDRLIKEARRAALAGLTLEEKLNAQKQIKTLESQRSTRRRALFDAQDEIDVRRGELIAKLEGKLQQNQSLRPVFTIRWSLV
jgi:ERCC4-related helicase